VRLVDYERATLSAFEKKKLRIKSYDLLRGTYHVLALLSRRELEQINLLYDPDRPDGRLNLTTSWVSTSSRGRTAYFPSGGPNHRQYLLRLPTGADDQAELALDGWFIARRFTCPKAVAHPITNRAQCRATSLIGIDAKPSRFGRTRTT